MPGPIMHLFITDRVYQSLPNNTGIDRALMLAGSLAPDAVHAKPDYNRQHKKTSHLKEELSDWDFHESNNQQVFKQRIGLFIANMMKKEREVQSYYLGYLCHLLTDAVFVLSLRSVIIDGACKASGKTGKEVGPEEIYQETDGLDHHIASRYSALDEIVTLLESVESMPVEDYVDKTDTRLSKEWVVRRIQQHAYGSHVQYISNEDIDDYIGKTCASIMETLSPLYA